MNHTRQLIYTVFFLLTSTLATAQDAWTPKQQQIIKAIAGLSATTTPEGKGADAYGEFLADDFSRWTVGSEVTNTKLDWIEGIREWFTDGWRVADRQQDILEIAIINDLAHVRRNVTETYVGPKGDTSSSKAALAELWMYQNNRWLLYRVNVHPIPVDK
ncbi:MAG: DUF4440 domain-containing protein [Fulvivirga sp.]